MAQNKSNNKRKKGKGKRAKVSAVNCMAKVNVDSHRVGNF